MESAEISKPLSVPLEWKLLNNYRVKHVHVISDTEDESAVYYIFNSVLLFCITTTYNSHLLLMWVVSYHSYLRPVVVKAVEEFKASVYGENYDQEEAEAAAAKAGASKKRKALTDAAAEKSAAHNWAELADTGKVSMQVLLPMGQQSVL